MKKSNLPQKYADIINLSRPQSAFPPISPASRAAQFAPFAALTGFSSKVENTKKDHLQDVEHEVIIDYDPPEEYPD